jgi:hypothetical protein
MTETSKHRQSHRKESRPGLRGSRAGGARVKPAEPVRRHQPGRFAWLRTTRGAVLLAVVVLGAAVALRLAVGGSKDDDTSASGPIGPAPQHFGTEWRTADGSSYQITLTQIAQHVAAAPRDGCVPPAAAGLTNLRFLVRIDNTGSKTAPVPSVAFAVNTKPSGAISKSLSFAKASRRISLTPAGAQSCADASRTGGGTIAPQSAATFTGMLGGVKRPVGAGLALIVRYTQADAAAPGGSGTAEITAIYPDMHALS